MVLLLASGGTSGRATGHARASRRAGRARGGRAGSRTAVRMAGWRPDLVTHSGDAGPPRATQRRPRRAAEAERHKPWTAGR